MSKTVYTSAADAEAAFYDALARGDLEAMMNVWAEDEDVVCIHPEGPRLTGLAAIRESWRALFSSGATLQVTVSHRIVWSNMMIAVHEVFEHVSLAGDDQLHPPMAATNVYSRGASGWKMVLHHASPTPDVPQSANRDTPRVVH